MDRTDYITKSLAGLFKRVGWGLLGASEFSRFILFPVGVLGLLKEKEEGRHSHRRMSLLPKVMHELQAILIKLRVFFSGLSA